MKLFSSVLFSLFCFSILYSSNTKEMTLHDFMENYVELAEKKFKKGEKEYLKSILKEIPNFAIEEDKLKWTEITDEAIQSEKLLSSCKTCHKLYKKNYKNNYKKRLIKIPEELLKK